MGTIIKRELLDQIQSIQFLVLSGASLLLFTVNALVFVKNYPVENSAYSRRVTETFAKSSTVNTELNQRPNPLRFVADGGDRYRPSGYSLNPGGFLRALPTGQINFKMPDIPQLDWSFLIRIVFSLYVLLLGFNAISGEREQGTLRLILSNSVRRSELLVAKFVAILAMATAPLLGGGLISLIIVAINQPQILTMANLARIALILPLTMCFLSVFVFMSLWVSSSVSRSSLVLLILLATWVLLTVIIPNTSGILAEKLSRAPSEYQMGRMVGPLIEKQVFDRIRAILSRAEKGQVSSAGEMRQEADKAYDEGQRDLVRHFSNYEAAMKDRAELSRRLTRISPAGLFQYALEDVMHAGKWREDDFLRDARNYAPIYDDYVLKKVGQLVGVSNFSFAVSTTIKGEDVILSSPSPKEYQGDKSDFPRFQENRISPLQGVQRALLDLVGLLVWTIILAGLAFSSFLRADVR
ncbi:MAG TPA: ABC transporter permease subunit [Acidobacteriota bacterium]|nr:ABC transporter permease subunit [Acidobacteriota bacterium]